LFNKFFSTALIAVIGLAGYTVSAQEGAVMAQEPIPTYKPLGITVKAGLNINTSDISSGESLVNYHIGALYELRAGKRLAIEPGLFFDSRGTKRNAGNVSGNAIISTNSPAVPQFENTIYRLNIPVTAKFFIINKEHTKWFLNIGPYLFIALKSKYELTANIKDRNDDYHQTTVKDTFKLGEDVDRTHIGLVFATGIELNQFVFSFGYDVGLSGIGPKLNTGTVERLI